MLKADADNYVLVWSFNDSLSPKLALECTKEVTVVAVHPLDGTLIVGGCANGQLSGSLISEAGHSDEREILRLTGRPLAHPWEDRANRNGHRQHSCPDEVQDCDKESEHVVEGNNGNVCRQAYGDVLPQGQPKISDNPDILDFLVRPD